MPGDLTARPLVLDAMTPSNDEIARLKPEPPGLQVVLEPCQVRFWSLQERR